MKTLLLVEDDRNFGYFLSEYLQMKGFAVDWVKDGKAASAQLEKKSYALAIFDVNLPDMLGYDLAQLLREKQLALPFIFLSARELKIDQLKGFRLGADDYITKPIDEEVLVAKIEAILSRHSGSTEVEKEEICFKSLVLFPAEQRLVLKGQEVQLSSRENDLLKMLLLQAGSLVSRHQLLHELWGETDEFARKSMDVFISRLRKHLEPADDIQIRNVHGKGFILE